MSVLSPIADNPHDPDCPKCGGEGVPQSMPHRFLAEEWSNMACPACWQDEADQRKEAGHG